MTEETEVSAPTETPQATAAPEAQTEAPETKATPEQDAQEAQAAFEAGFNGDRDTPVKAKPANEPQKPQADPLATMRAELEKAAEEKAEAMLNARTAAIEQKHAAELRRIYGMIGEIKGKQMEASKAPGKKLTPEALKRIRQNYGEDLARDLSEDLNEATAPPPEPPVDRSQIEREYMAKIGPQFSAQIDKIRRDHQDELMSAIHKDWREILPSPEFKKWWFALPEEKRAGFNSTQAVVAAQAITEFKAQRDKAVKAAQANKTRLEAAVAPRGAATPQTQMSDEDAFLAGFNSVNSGSL